MQPTDTICIYTSGKMPSGHVKWLICGNSPGDVKEWDKGKRLRFWWCKRMGQEKTKHVQLNKRNMQPIQ